MRRPCLSAAYTALMNLRCHGRSRNKVPASGPELTGRDSMKRQTRSARERPLAVHGCGAEERRSRPAEARLIVFRFGPARPTNLPSKWRFRLGYRYQIGAFPQAVEPILRSRIVQLFLGLQGAPRQPVTFFGFRPPGGCLQSHRGSNRHACSRPQFVSKENCRQQRR
jgi:hypothetical protein